MVKPMSEQPLPPTPIAPPRLEHTTSSDLQVDTGTEGCIDLLQDGALITRYHYANVPARPYFHPLNGPGNISLTRGYPMQQIPGETADHPHHRSLWIAHGDVNGVDNWSEESGHGYTRHLSIDSLDVETDYAGFRTTSLWASPENTPLLTQSLEVKAWRGNAIVRLIDFQIELIATEGDVRFGDTKEGGILSIRVASSMDVPRGGKITNAVGGVDEKECWGKHAAWCCYSGRIDDTQTGIAVLNHPDSFRAPSTWHVRNYGLMTANPFGYAAFTNGAENGDYHLPHGDRLLFRYRLVLCRGALEAHPIAGYYSDYIARHM